MMPEEQGEKEKKKNIYITLVFQRQPRNHTNCDGKLWCRARIVVLWLHVYRNICYPNYVSINVGFRAEVVLISVMQRKETQLLLQLYFTLYGVLTHKTKEEVQVALKKVRKIVVVTFFCLITLLPQLRL